MALSYHEERQRLEKIGLITSRDHETSVGLKNLLIELILETQESREVNKSLLERLDKHIEKTNHLLDRVRFNTL